MKSRNVVGGQGDYPLPETKPAPRTALYIGPVVARCLVDRPDILRRLHGGKGTRKAADITSWGAGGGGRGFRGGRISWTCSPQEARFTPLDGYVMDQWRRSGLPSSPRGLLNKNGQAGLKKLVRVGA